MRSAANGIAAVLLTQFATGCTSFDSIPQPNFMLYANDKSRIQLEGWFRYSGEMALYHSEEALKLDLLYPYCVNLLNGSVSDKALKKLSGSKILATGRLVKYEEIPEDQIDEEFGIATGRLYEGNIVYNYCWGEYIIVLEDAVRK